MAVPDLKDKHMLKPGAATGKNNEHLVPAREFAKLTDYPRASSTAAGMPTGPAPSRA
ncbi:hypothetical protein H3H36_20520 [Duganella sp. FT3S]|uniref:Uncharacterized protein n=1 Tax=Rugamonas fusca TaxID=2758568 RepID=A0A7W2I8N7_9BURK|nr:hypothetical protein [Rugamonas fusca]MBA5607744.1 hypothetical protein [Rugamonas fusca]